MAKKKSSNMITQVMSAAIEAADRSDDKLTTLTTDNKEVPLNLDTLKNAKMELEEEIVYDDVVKPVDELARLSKENSELTDKIGEYIEEKKEIEKKLRDIQAKYDDSLLKISELSFEIAKLKAEQKTTSKGNIDPSNKLNETPSSMRVSYPSYHMNGYDDWN